LSGRRSEVLNSAGSTMTTVRPRALHPLGGGDHSGRRCGARSSRPISGRRGGGCARGRIPTFATRPCTAVDATSRDQRDPDHGYDPRPGRSSGIGPNSNPRGLPVGDVRSLVTRATAMKPIYTIARGRGDLALPRCGKSGPRLVEDARRNLYPSPWSPRILLPESNGSRLHDRRQEVVYQASAARAVYRVARRADGRLYLTTEEGGRSSSRRARSTVCSRRIAWMASCSRPPRRPEVYW
jgi:hypothetical protein